MAVMLMNQAKYMLIVPLNDGQSIHLAPGGTSGALDEAQLSGNERLGKLIGNGLVAVVRETERTEAAAKDAGAKEQPAAAAKSTAATAPPAAAAPPADAEDTSPAQPADTNQ
jgi:hypothetical protein